MSPVEKVIRPIVEGKIRTFITEHSGLLNCIDWFKAREDKAQTFVNSLSKRILGELLSDSVIARIKTALEDGLPSEQPSGDYRRHAVAAAGPIPSESGWFYALPIRYDEAHAEAAMILRVVKDRSGALMVSNGQLYPLDQFKWYGKVPMLSIASTLSKSAPLKKDDDNG